MNAACQTFPDAVRQMLELGLLRELDAYLVESVLRTHGAAASEEAWLALALASRAVEDGHTCLDLAGLTLDWILGRNPEAAAAALPPSVRDLCGRLVARSGCLELAAAGAAPALPPKTGRRPPARRKPERSARVGAGSAAGGWRALFEPLAPVVGTGSGAAPFVWDGARLYLRRYWEYEQAIARRLRDMAAAELPPPPALARLLESSGANAEQARAIRLALTRRLAIVTGGPGTGKTFAAARILALLTHLRGPDDRPLRIRLAAPTGKAAARLDESLAEAVAAMPAAMIRADAALEPAATVDRLLGYQEGSPYFRHHGQNPLPADVLLLDEASMLDLAKTAKLLEALAPETRLVLLGDMRQLASVQPGSVLAELGEAPCLAPCVARLTQSIRFGPGTPLGRFSAAVVAADTPAQAAEAWALAATPAADGAPAGVRHQPVPASLADRSGAVDPAFARSVLAGYGPFLAAGTPGQAFAALRQFRVLCALRHGPLGALRVNQAIENALFHGRRPQAGAFYHHRVLIVTRNDYALRLFNGDVGVVLPDPDAGGAPVAFFERLGRPKPGQDRFRKISCGRLPEHETAFAMTVHKAQGSEFERVLVLLPERDSPLLTRELLYTAVTRSRGAVELWCGEAVFQAAVMRRTRRASGLTRALGGAGSDISSTLS